MSDSKNLLLPAFYLGPISYFELIKQSESPILIEAHEHFPKQTYRTRARIASANGALDIIVPIQHGKKEHTPLKDIKINYDHDWQRLHWLSIQTAYRSSPYFEYYEDEFQRFYSEKFDYLLDFNMQQLELLLKCLKINKELQLTKEYIATPESENDYRETIHPKKPSISNAQKEYSQVFDVKNGFLKDLSIIDLLFNQGPIAKNFL